MSFLWPIMLGTLVLIPLVFLMYRRAHERRRARAAQVGSMGLLRSASGQRLGKRRHVPAALFLAALAVLLLALARPQAVVSLPRVEGTLILAFDVSGSMAANDVAPTRMDAAKAVAQELVERQPPTVQIGVVAFSDGGFPVQPPTTDQDAVLSAISRIEPRQGTSIGQGIQAALNVLVTKPQGPRRYSSLTPTPTVAPTTTPATIVLLTDGENNGPPDPMEVADLAKQRGVRIFPIGIGSTTGTTLDVNGFRVFTRLDEPTLQAIAQLTSGEYFNVANEQNLRAIGEQIDLQFVVKPEKIELTALLSGIGLLLLTIGAACSLLWFGRVP